MLTGSACGADAGGLCAPEQPGEVRKGGRGGQQGVNGQTGGGPAAFKNRKIKLAEWVKDRSYGVAAKIRARKRQPR